LRFKRIAVQKIGVTGYTAVYETAESDGVWRLWTHINPNVVGIDTSSLKESLEILSRVLEDLYRCQRGKGVPGYYKWRDTDGIVRDKFMVCIPIDGTPYVLAATAYLAEFTERRNRCRKVPLNSLLRRETLLLASWVAH